MNTTTAPAATPLHSPPAVTARCAKSVKSGLNAAGPRKNTKPAAPRSSSTERTIYLCGDIDENLSRSLLPEIYRLKADRSEPITVYIDSPGGSIMHAERIISLLRAVDENGQRPAIITLAAGDACSAAARILAQGDHVKAFRHAHIHFHGARTFDQSVTRARAEELEGELETQDQYAARSLALRVFGRMLKVSSTYAEEISQARQTGGMFVGELDDLIAEGAFDIPALALVIWERVGECSRELLLSSLRGMRRIKVILNLYQKFQANKIDPVILGLAPSGARSIRKRSQMQLRVLEAVLGGQIAADKEWDLRVESFQRIRADFLQVTALAEDFWHPELLDLLLSHEALFFTGKDASVVQSLRASLSVEEFGADKSAQKKLDTAVGHAYRKAEPLWQFVSTLCRNLQEGENGIPPEDAWHLGLIDEVIGLPLSHGIHAEFEPKAGQQQSKAMLA